jgi:hypothetical protein
MPHNSFDWLRKHRGALWVLIPVVALDIWFDYYHPRGIVLDVIIVLALFIKFGLGEDRA